MTFQSLVRFRVLRSEPFASLRRLCTSTRIGKLVAGHLITAKSVGSYGAASILIAATGNRLCEACGNVGGIMSPTMLLRFIFPAQHHVLSLLRFSRRQKAARLTVPQLGVEAPAAQELGMVTLFHDLTLVEHNQPIHCRNG